MIVRNVNDVIDTDLEVKTDNWLSRRVLLQKDGMGFSFHETVIFPGTETHIHYVNHLEAVWCIEGDGEIETIADGKKYALGPGVVYALDQNRSEEQTSELQSLMRNSYAVFCLKK